MRLGVFTALLGQLPLDDVLRKLTGLGEQTVELGTGNYPGGPPEGHPRDRRDPGSRVDDRGTAADASGGE